MQEQVKEVAEIINKTSDYIITRVSEPESAAPCLICGEEVIILDPYSYPVVCDDCKRAVQIVKKLYKNKPCWDCKDFKCGCCTKFVSF